MTLEDVCAFIDSLSREDAIAVAGAARKRLAAIREADPYLYIIERVHYTTHWLPHSTRLGHLSYSTWSQGQIVFFANSIEEHGGIARGKELSKDGGTGLAFWTCRSYAVDYLNWVRERVKETPNRYFRIREIEKATGKLCDFEEQLTKATEGVSL